MHATFCPRMALLAILRDDLDVTTTGHLYRLTPHTDIWSSGEHRRAPRCRLKGCSAAAGSIGSPCYRSPSERDCGAPRVPPTRAAATALDSALRLCASFPRRDWSSLIRARPLPRPLGGWGWPAVIRVRALPRSLRGRDWSSVIPTRPPCRSLRERDWPSAIRAQPRSSRGICSRDRLGWLG
jgi:hypothetical protein